jgi:hypothetical protein
MLNHGSGNDTAKGFAWEDLGDIPLFTWKLTYVPNICGIFRIPFVAVTLIVIDKMGQESARGRAYLQHGQTLGNIVLENQRGPVAQALVYIKSVLGGHMRANGTLVTLPVFLLVISPKIRERRLDELEPTMGADID